MAEWLRQGPAKPCTRVRFPLPPRAISSVGERFLDTEEVTGSIPVSPTSENGLSRSRERPFDTESDNNAGARCRAPAFVGCRASVTRLLATAASRRLGRLEVGSAAEGVVDPAIAVAVRVALGRLRPCRWTAAVPETRARPRSPSFAPRADRARPARVRSRMSNLAGERGGAGGCWSRCGGGGQAFVLS